ncbi:MAG: hypothetical protein COA44_13730 [Arcobacter sp.]|nr:MAG: hypothetical protein COA44_13730 [Arcobacter sp.]
MHNYASGSLRLFAYRTSSNEEAFNIHDEKGETRGFLTGTPLADAKEGNSEKEYLVSLGYTHHINTNFALKRQSTYHDWSLDKQRYNGIWEYTSLSWYNEAELHMFKNSDSSNILGISF